MHNYELVFIIQADLDETTLNSIVENVESLIKSNSGEVVKTDRWGKRKLAYPIRKINEGYYTFIAFNLLPKNVADLKRSLGYNEQILRHIIVRAS